MVIVDCSRNPSFPQSHSRTSSLCAEPLRDKHSCEHHNVASSLNQKPQLHSRDTETKIVTVAGIVSLEDIISVRRVVIQDERACFTGPALLLSNDAQVDLQEQSLAGRLSSL